MKERNSSRLLVFALGVLSGALLTPLLLLARAAGGSGGRRKGSVAAKRRARAKPAAAAAGGPAGLVKPARTARARELRPVPRLS